MEVKPPRGVNPKDFFADMRGKGKGKGKSKGKGKEHQPPKRKVSDYPNNYRLLVTIRATKLYQDRCNPLSFYIQQTVLQEIGGAHTGKTTPSPYLRDWKNQFYGKRSDDEKAKAKGKKGGAKGKMGSSRMAAEVGRKAQGAEAAGGGFHW